MFIAISILLLCLLGMSLLFNFLRAHLQPLEELTPNCLLTRFPILFIEGEKSIFYFSTYWNQIPHFLASHGYEVHILELPWRGLMNRAESAREFIAGLEGKYHIIADATQSHLIHHIIEFNKPQIQTATLVDHIQKNSSTLQASDLSPKAIPIHSLNLSTHKCTLTPLAITMRMIWFLHKMFLFPRRTPTMNSIGLLAGKDVKFILNDFLHHAILLAETDLGAK